jgi:hypothetical protein
MLRSRVDAARATLALKSRRYNDQLPMIAAAGQIWVSQTDIGSDFPKKSLICSG